jgi:hypothetical protein
VVAVPVLEAPASGETRKNPVNFRWSGRLTEGQSYVLEAWHVETSHRIEVLTQANEYEADLPAERFGMWRWRVGVIAGDTLAAQSREREFWFNPLPGVEGEPEATPVPTNRVEGEPEATPVPTNPPPDR